ncbi:MAG: magnesium-translocating P-type ATPase [bacterium]
MKSNTYKTPLLWNATSQELLHQLNTSLSGLSEHEAQIRQKQNGLNIIHKQKLNIITVFVRQFTSNPLILILVIATCISFLLGQRTSSYYIFGTIMLGIGLGLWNEYSAEKTVDNLLKKISPTTLVIRNNEKIQIPASHITVGDIVLLSQGSIIPADVQFIETNNLEVNESSLTGESKTVYKTSEKLDTKPQTISEYKNTGFMGTEVTSGMGRGVVVGIGTDTEFGKIAKSVIFVKPITEFQRGLMQFGNMIVWIIVFITIVIFAVNAFLGHALIDSLLFSLAIAVGLTPELLPVIVTISLSHGAGKLAKRHVVAKQLIAIENLGNMDVLCTDKTGTLTEGKIDVVSYVGREEESNEMVLHYSLLCNSVLVHHKAVGGNAIDVALWEHALKEKIVLNKKIKKLDEEPFDYIRKAMFCVVDDSDGLKIIVKGAPDSILAFCDESTNKKILHSKFIDLNSQGMRVIAIASKKIEKKARYSWEDVKDVVFEGYITFRDVPKKTAKDALTQLARLNVQTKLITGDNEIVARHVCGEVGINTEHILVGPSIERLNDEELVQKVDETTVFARVNPEQKLRIIFALKKNGHVVGYMGDGINDIPSLHSADVGISVNSAVDVAKDAATIVLLRKSLRVLTDGIIEGRKTFNNTIKYILMATSSNFGNMFSAAGASFFLSFLPMTAPQILLTNGLYDLSQTGIPADNVDPEALLKPKHWNVNFIKRYMLFFGPLSSLFDFATFGILYFGFHARGSLFQTGWFIESMATQILVVFVIRTFRSPFFLSNPSPQLLTTCIALVALVVGLPYTSLGGTLGFVPLPMAYFIILILLVTSYLFLVEVVKNIFLKKVGGS